MPTKAPCIDCGERRVLREDTSQCADCYRKAQGRRRIKEYRTRRKIDGKPDTSAVPPQKDLERKRRKAAAKRAARAAAPPPPPVPEEVEIQQKVDQIAQKDTAAELSPAERRALSSSEAVAVELARRELARRDLLYFIKRRNPRYKAGWFHRTVCNALMQFSEEVENELSPRLMVFAPPRHGKSKIGSEEFPAFHLGRVPWHEFIGVSYSAPLAYRFSRRVQDIIESEDFRLLYPDVRLRDDKTSVEEWELNKGGVYVAAGVGGPISGKGAHVLNIDDVIKNREEADSPQQRRLVQDWYTSTAYTRLMPGGGVCVINTRWNFEDLCGWLLAMMEAADKIAQETGEWPEDHDKWTIVDYPAIAIEDEKYRKKGEALHPERYSLKALLRIRNTIGERDFNALYQQRPVPDEGEYFTKDMIKYFDGEPDPRDFTFIAAGDLAISKKEYADYSVFVVAGINANDDIFIFDVVRGKWNSLELVDRIFEIQRRYSPVLFGLEQGQIEKALGPLLEKRIMEERLFSLHIELLPPGKRDKELRARPIQGRMRQGKVYIRRGASWTDAYVTELLRFPGSSKDDQVDATAWIGQMMNTVHHSVPEKPEIASWRDRLASLDDEDVVSRHPAMAA